MSERDSSTELVDLEAEKQVEEIIKQVEAPPQVKERIRQSLSMTFMAMTKFERSPTVSPESLKILTDFLSKDSDNNKELALREIESNDKLQISENEQEKEKQDHFIWTSKLLHLSAVTVGLSILIFAGYLIITGNSSLGEKMITHGLAFVAGMGVKRMIS